jgi:hypothetical protein
MADRNEYIKLMNELSSVNSNLSQLLDKYSENITTFEKRIQEAKIKMTFGGKHDDLLFQVLKLFFLSFLLVDLISHIIQ